MAKYANNKYAQIPQQVNISDKPRGKLTIECDEEKLQDWSDIETVNFWRSPT